jgi:hypothetical protein
MPALRVAADDRVSAGLFGLIHGTVGASRDGGGGLAGRR